MPLVAILPSGDWSVLESDAEVTFFVMTDLEFEEFENSDGTYYSGELVGKYTPEGLWNPCVHWPTQEEDDKEEDYAPR